MLTVIVILVIVAFVIGGALAVVLAIGLLAKDEKGRKTALANEPDVLDAAFTAEDVTFKVGPATLPYENVVLGAKHRGYRLIGESEEPGNRKTLVFTRETPTA